MNEAIGDSDAHCCKADKSKAELTARLHENPVPHERHEIERLLVKVDTELERKRVAADEGAKALQDAADQAVAVRENMARLRDLRLAREAQAELTND